MTDDSYIRGARVLVVDDNEQNRALARATLEAEGVEVVLAEGGEEGVMAFERERPACVLMDVRMPGTDGFEACRRIRALPGGKEASVIFITALRDVDTFDSAVEVGCDDFLTKPFRPAELVARVRTALELRRLGAEVRELGVRLRKQRDDLMRLQLHKERLMSFVVHDLKNPVNTVDLFAQMLARDGTLPTPVRESAAHIRSAVRHAMRLILNLLDISKSEEGKLVAQLAPVDARALVEQVVESMGMTATSREVVLATAVETPTIECDRDLLARVLENLVENAIRHTRAGGRVTLAVRATEEGAEVSVADEGTGIPAGLRERIFEPFVQLSETDDLPSRTGRGLGLAFCKVAATAHGGTIEAVPVDAGALIRLRWPGAPRG